ncbi:FMN-linked oxidoreductase [Dendrothele bispora CBS 962.96]|uniref:FMN-linked oxidoreductase n=1 Tax=Dendrothele bispora (strain CBS 962.96) TaxID=1314807 RepID=A0A4V4HF52_DENBC|nr:FMN-linked oxidoreductase [Dendrothele bispora CBS 962.96]
MQIQTDYGKSPRASNIDSCPIPLLWSLLSQSSPTSPPLVYPSSLLHKTLLRVLQSILNPVEVPSPNFSPLSRFKIRDVTFQNRIFVPPLCQYSADNGHATPWHMAHVGGIVSRGFGLMIMEGTGVTPEGRITPEDLGLWQDSQIEPLKHVVDFAHSQGQKIGIQLAHAGRKSSTVAPWLHPNAIAAPAVGGFADKIVGPSPILYTKGNPVPKELSKAEIADIVKADADAAKRATRAGFDPSRQHGGSFENRIRFTLEVVDAIRAVIPEGMPLSLRISASDRMEDLDEPSWKNEDTIRLARILAEHGVDLLHVSSAGISPKQFLKMLTAQQDMAAEMKKEVGDKIFVGTVGGIKSGVQAEKYLQDNVADVCFVGRYTQKEPGIVWKFAEELGTVIHVAGQIAWGFFGRGVGSKAAKVKAEIGLALQFLRLAKLGSLKTLCNGG